MDQGPLFLLVDDDQDDIMLLKEALLSVKKNIQFAEAWDGSAALKYLQTAMLQEELPDLVVLDVNMPILNGREVIAFIKNDVVLRDIPLVVFSTSSYPADKVFFSQYGVEFITKPIGIEPMVAIAKRLIHTCS